MAMPTSEVGIELTGVSTSKESDELIETATFEEDREMATSEEDGAGDPRQPYDAAAKATSEKIRRRKKWLD